MGLKLMQGDACRIPFRIRQDGLVVTPEMITDLEVTVGKLRKTYLAGEIAWGGEYWFVYLSQEETMAMNGTDYIRVRVRYLDQPWVVVSGKRAEMVYVETHSGAEVL